MRHIDPSHRSPSSHASSPRGRSGSKQASIVVIDPDPISLIAMAGVLHTQGYSCTCARSSDAAAQALQAARQDLLLWDVADDAAGALEALGRLREQQEYSQLPAVLVAESQWAGLETKTEAMPAPTRCLFKPIDPNSLIAIVEHVLWMPTLVSAHRRKGSTPSRPGWVTL